MDELPIRLKMMRKKLKLTQEELSKLANTTIANISCYESGNQSPSARTLLRLSTALQCSVDYFLGLTNVPDIQAKEVRNHKPILSYQELIARYSIILENGDPLTNEEVKEMFEYIQCKSYMNQKRMNHNQPLEK